MSGWCNNLREKSWGGAGTAFKRLVPDGWSPFFSFHHTLSFLFLKNYPAIILQSFQKACSRQSVPVHIIDTLKF